MRLERRTVSRKTPLDGKLEITKQAASSLVPLGSAFAVRALGQPGQATLGEYPCSCRGGDTPHVHYFLVSETFKALAPGSEVDIDFDADARQLRVDAP
jgi:hypothetical protein